MSEALTIQPFTRPVRGRVTLPGSKSITNRALILAALSQESLTLEAALFSDDTRIMANALRALGITVSEDEAGKTIFVNGCGGSIPNPEAEIYVGNAGTAARFLTAMLCLREGGVYRMDGSAPMRKRPMRGLLDALVTHGAATVEYHGEPGFFPFTLRTNGVPGGELSVDASASSQILSALLMVAPLAKGPLTLTLAGETVSHPFIGMTLAMIEQFGIQPQGKSDTGPFPFTGGGRYYYPRPAYVVEPDATAASYYAMLPWVIGGSLTLERCYGIGLQGDIHFIEILGQLGAFFNVDGADLVAEFRERKQGGVTEDFNAISDTFLTLAAITPLLDGPTTISGIAHTRHQETDRIAAMATELRKLGQRVDETDDSMTVHPDFTAIVAKTKDSPLAIDTYEDHRVAMSFGILGSHDLHGDGRPWLTINDPNCCAKTFPNFFDVLKALRG
ncbi:3-phosphoshikimate 1-carboxyvinyltransferase [Cerasicoccus arenae]|uniref:3-phosphoshikimate 1-carboxyvinyltransferase n=1 Tax=Cerasicoccus arenae TaxID=424488 RepID=A0A8J3DDX5_9BACT|nr:3-phosphoshikimate 1-carboxyvinyltransferase [Cerasicoccus arenae]MBK1857436.1 3-phosphoshikimate 1-carboxyvinyltransferase [Cerasicoccus arenae]GHC07728.1 3-phosphoshikimate 1-carboxyvinyltransferase [Cerasicoccus arenae]